MIQHVRRKLASALPAVPEVTIPISYALQTAVKSVLLLRIRLSGVLSAGVTAVSLVRSESLATHILLAVSIALCSDSSGLVFCKISRYR
ncbi:hypothetical protein K7472_08035 [Streptomyces sp. PTM05]|uniref:Uncharacterized protein n=1 Tax=Streptantibioticus parmotrematis TaxID=2873249 RepID=A0ABS7QQ55_9ACTN|nr:hypothetical protein [Streptantibioticus parmotrematis]MBY8884794.1 hypothetical protein [Streptantibioticus parmotrematis]